MDEVDGSSSTYESRSPRRIKLVDEVDTLGSTRWYIASQHLHLPSRPAARRRSAPEDNTLTMSRKCRIDPDGVWDWPLDKRQMRYRVLHLFKRDELASDQLILRERQAGRALR